MNLILRFSRLLPLAAVIAVPLIGSAACNAQVATVLNSDAGTDSSSPQGGGGAVCATDADCNDNPAVSSLWGSCAAGVCICHPGFAKQPNGKCNTTPTTSACVAKGGHCETVEGAPPPGYRAEPGQGCLGSDVCMVPISTTSPGPVCFKDQDCNNDKTVSALWGKCFYGVCMCQPSFTVQTNGKCDKPGPLDCTAQKGTCRQMPAACQMFEIRAQEAPMSCGDFVESVCCVSTKLCNAPGQEVPGGGFTPVDFLCCAPNDAIDPPICVNGWKVCPAGDLAVAKPGGCPSG